MNVANGRLIKTGFKNIFISPVPDDSGACMGAASYKNNEIYKKKKYICKNF